MTDIYWEAGRRPFTWKHRANYDAHTSGHKGNTCCAPFYLYDIISAPRWPQSTARYSILRLWTLGISIFPTNQQGFSLNSTAIYGQRGAQAHVTYGCEQRDRCRYTDTDRVLGIAAYLLHHSQKEERGRMKKNQKNRRGEPSSSAITELCCSAVENRKCHEVVAYRPT